MNKEDYGYTLIMRPQGGHGALQCRKTDTLRAREAGARK